MLKDWFEAFSPRHAVPLVVEFVSFAKENGFSSGARFDYWDFELFDRSDSPFMVVKTIKNRVTPKLLEMVLREDAPLKVILAEGGNFSDENLKNNRLFLASTGVGLFVRGRGWLVRPSRPKIEVKSDLRLHMAPRWEQDTDGNWWKACSKCGESYGPKGYYRNYRNNTKDPYQAQCKICWSKDNERTRKRMARHKRPIESVPVQDGT